MSGGGKQEIINTLERALSTDINRLQLFASMDRAEIYRFLCDVGIGSDDVEASSALTQVTTLTTPLTAEIFGGFCVRPDVGDLNLAVDPGVLMCINPDSDPDSSNYKLVRDPGLANTGGLAITANSSGSTRIDVVECSYVLNTVETDNRDIFNPATNSFSASSVTKATQAGLTYRVRAGSPGGGYPGAVSGWLPLCVASVPNGTTTNDTVTFWDVRPLLADRVNAPFNGGKFGSQVLSSDFTLYTTNVGVSNLIGTVEAVASDLASGSARARGIYRLGGNLARGTPGTDGTLNVSDPANCSGSFTNNTPTYVYLLEPFGLPRWARYTDASTGLRNPRNPRGIPVTSQVAPRAPGAAGFGGQPTSAIALPTSTGLAGSTSKGVAIAAGVWSTVSGTLIETAALQSRGREQTNAPGTFAGPNAVVSGSAGTQSVTYTLTAGTHCPAYARTLKVGFNLTITAPTVGTFTFSYTVTDSAAQVFAVGQDTWIVPAGGGTTQWTKDIPLSLSGGPYTITIATTATGGTVPTIASAAALQIYGWGL
jgi:hypothetical protein